MKLSQSTLDELSESELDTISGGAGNLLADLNQSVANALDKVLKSFPSFTLPPTSGSSSVADTSCPPTDSSTPITIA